MTALSIPASAGRERPSFEGLEVTDEAWRLDPSTYHGFIREATGIEPSIDHTGADCYRIGNRLEAIIDERKRNGEWTATVVEKYPDIESLEEYVWLARFFRRCHECRTDGACS